MNVRREPEGTHLPTLDLRCRFHVEPSEDPVARAANWLGVTLDRDQLAILARYERWLREEAISAGGLGPQEGSRLRSRHLADSLLFAIGWDDPDPPARLLDLGAGVGLPGIPLAVLWPGTEVCLLDRSQRRTDLVRRALRVIGIEAQVVTVDVRRYRGEPADLVVARGAAPPAEVKQWAAPLLRRGGRVVIGGSTVARPGPGPGERVVGVPSSVLDRPLWFRIMAAT